MLVPASYGSSPLTYLRALLVLGFAVAAAVSYGLRRYVALIFGAGGCDLGVPAGVPDLRDAPKER